jgi:hypothetical protein
LPLRESYPTVPGLPLKLFDQRVQIVDMS